MTITKNQKMLLGVGALAVAGYLVYQQMNKNNMVGFNSNKKNFLPTTLQNYTVRCGDGTGVYTFRHPEIYINNFTGTSEIFTAKEAAIFIASQDTICKTRNGISSIRKF